MSKQGQHDHSPGDDRKPYSSEGGPAGRHADTHDVQREAFTNPKGPTPRDESFDQDLAYQAPASQIHGHADDSRFAMDDKGLVQRLDRLDAAELARLPVVEPGTRLEQGGVYVDLNDLAQGPFKAIGGQEAGAGNRYVPKRDVDYELWNRLVGDDDAPEIARPAAQGASSQRGQ